VGKENQRRRQIFMLRGLREILVGHKHIASMRAQSYNGDMGTQPQRGPGAEPMVRRSGRWSPGKTESLFVLWRLI